MASGDDVDDAAAPTEPGSSETDSGPSSQGRRRLLIAGLGSVAAGFTGVLGGRALLRDRPSDGVAGPPSATPSPTPVPLVPSESGSSPTSSPSATEAASEGAHNDPPDDADPDDADPDDADPDDDSPPVDVPEVTGARWSDPKTWQSGKVPGPGDVANVDRDIVLDVDAEVAGVEISPAGQLMFLPNKSVLLESSENVLVLGRLTMVPASADVEHVLRFVDVDESAMVGGGMDPVATDVGLWVTGAGVLRAEGHRRRGWNRTGSDSTWRGGDEVMVAPMASGDFSGFAPFRPGSSVPVARGLGETVGAEVFNLTRNVRIEGTPSGRAHIMFTMCRKPQTVRFVAIRHVGPAPQGDGRSGDQAQFHSTGRYGLHFHHCQDGTRGTIVEGVVIRDCGGHAFVPHASHGITMTDCIAYGVAADAYWWDPEPDPTSYPSNATHDLVYDHCAALDVAPQGGFKGFELAGFFLGQGEGNRCIDCAAAGVRGLVNSSGFHWPSKANGQPNVWDFRDGVAHNNTRHGIFVWQNDSSDHLVKRFVGFNNGGWGVNHGAYLNRYRYEQLVLFDNERGVTQHAGGRGGGHTVQTQLRTSDSLVIAGHPIPFEGPARFVECEFPSPVVVNGAIGGRPSTQGNYEFFDCKADGRPLAPSDFEFVVAPENTRIHVQNGSEAYEIDGDGSRPVDPINH